MAQLGELASAWLGRDVKGGKVHGLLPFAAELLH